MECVSTVSREVIRMRIHIDSGLIAENDILVVAVSGGIDSMVLLDLLANLRTRRKIRLIVAHVDHQKRRSSTADADFVAERSAAYGVPCERMTLDPDGTGNFHERARTARYAFFLSVARMYGANKIAVAHQADDQAETILMRIVRGSGLAGYAGIPETSSIDGIKLVRPLLGVSRKQIEAYARERGITFREDESNAQDHYTRNRFRHRIVPEIAKENPHYLAKFSQFSSYLGEAYAVVSRLSEEFVRTSVQTTSGRVAFRVCEFNALDPAVMKETVKRCYDLLTGNEGELGYAQILACIDILCSSKPRGSYDLPSGRRIERDYDEAAFVTATVDSVAVCVPIPGFGTYQLADGGSITVGEKPVEIDGNCIELCYNMLDFVFPMSVRTRKDGDRITFAYGTKKLKDLFIDRKIPMRERNRMPLLVGKNGEILWIPELSIRAAMPSGRASLSITYQRGTDRHA
jgi:tRNA(Ile)-lysidine synthase